MSIRTNKMLAARYADWDNLHCYFPCNEQNTDDLTDVTGNITIASADIARKYDHGVDAGFNKAAPTTGSVAFTINEGDSFALLLHGKINAFDTFCKVSFGDSASTDIISMAIKLSEVRLGSEVTKFSNMEGSAVAGNETCMSAFIFNHATKTAKIYQSIEGGTVSEEGSTAITDAMLQAVTLTDNIALNGVGTEQTLYGFSLIKFNSVPSTFESDLQDIERLWKEGKAYLPENWKNA